jgi:hypothetical protein
MMDRVVDHQKLSRTSLPKQNSEHYCQDSGTQTQKKRSGSPFNSLETFLDLVFDGVSPPPLFFKLIS